MWCHPPCSHHCCPASIKTGQTSLEKEIESMTISQWCCLCLEARAAQRDLVSHSSCGTCGTTCCHAHTIFYKENRSIRAFCNKKSTRKSFLELTLQKKHKINTIILCFLTSFEFESSLTKCQNQMGLTFPLTVKCVGDAAEIIIIITIIFFRVEMIFIYLHPPLVS